MNRTINENGLALLKSFENCKLRAYRDSGGVLTIGWGHTLNVHPTDVITQKRADELFFQDLSQTEAGVQRLCCGVALNSNQYSALVVFSYNIGIGSFAKSTLLRKVKANPTDSTIKEEFESWCYCKGKISEGLVRRRKKEAQLYFTK